MAQSIHQGIFTTVDSRVPAVGGFGRTLADLSLDRTKLLFAAQMAMLWFGGLAVLIWFFVIALRAGSAAGATLFVMLALLWTPAACGLLIGGIGRLVTLDLDGSRSGSTQPAWNFLRQRWPGLALGIWAVSTGFDLLVLAVIAVIQAVASAPSAGPVLGGLMVAPVFFAVLFAAVFHLSLWMLPCVMSVEGSGLKQAVMVLARMAREAPVAMTGMVRGAIDHLKSMAGVALWSGIVVAGGLLISNAICGGDLSTWLGSNQSSVGWGVAFRFLSISFILCGWFSFLLAYFAAGITMAYHQVRR
jgi:hypothetical protein